MTWLYTLEMRRPSLTTEVSVQVNQTDIEVNKINIEVNKTNIEVNSGKPSSKEPGQPTWKVSSAPYHIQRHVRA